MVQTYAAAGTAAKPRTDGYLVLSYGAHQSACIAPRRVWSLWFLLNLGHVFTVRTRMVLRPYVFVAVAADLARLNRLTTIRAQHGGFRHSRFNPILHIALVHVISIWSRLGLQTRTPVTPTDGTYLVVGLDVEGDERQLIAGEQND